MNTSAPITAKEFDRTIELTVPLYTEFYRQTIDLVKSLPLPAGKWLDTGCGTGEFVSQALKEFDGFRFVLCDPSQAMAAEAAAKLSAAAQDAEIHICGSQDLCFHEEFAVVTAIQSHHYLRGGERRRALECCHEALKEGGVFIFFENIAPDSQYAKSVVLDRWGRYQKSRGKTEEETARHLSRYGTQYFPLTLAEHHALLRQCRFRYTETFWLSFMQAGMYAVK